MGKKKTYQPQTGEFTGFLNNQQYPYAPWRFTYILLKFYNYILYIYIIIYILYILYILYFYIYIIYISNIGKYSIHQQYQDVFFFSMAVPCPLQVRLFLQRRLRSWLLQAGIPGPIVYQKTCYRWWLFAAPKKAYMIGSQQKIGMNIWQRKDNNDK